MRLAARLAFIIVVLIGTQAARAEQLVGPRLGAATNFGQSWFPSILSGARNLPLTVYRDEMFWDGIEQPDGTFVFDNPRTRYPDLIYEAGDEVMFIVNNGHPSYDDGWTPHSPEAVAAFANYTTQIVQRFPAITTLEIGNEMNSDTFAVGPGWSEDIEVRAASYARLLRATALAVRKTRPDIRILGGAAHSIPITWFREVFRHDVAQYIDALVIHPYTVEPEQLSRQIRLLRDQVPQIAHLPLAVTEFGEDRQSVAPSKLVKDYCQMAVSGVESAIWYPLNPRGDGLTALLEQDGSITATGRTFQMAAKWFEGRLVTEYRPDPFTYGCHFGNDTLVVWGEARDVTLGAGFTAYDVFGNPKSDKTLTLSPDEPLIVRGRGLDPNDGASFRLSQSMLIADSYHQFAYPGYDGDPFQRLVRKGSEVVPFILGPGQERGGVPWTPYLRTELDGLARAAADWVLPSHPDGGPIEVLFRYVNPTEETLKLTVKVAPTADTDDGVILRVTQNDRVLRRLQITASTTVTIDDLVANSGDILDFALGPNTNDIGDASDFRVTISRAKK